jgi:high-affinity nickel permease
MESPSEDGEGFNLMVVPVLIVLAFIVGLINLFKMIKSKLKKLLD